MIRIHLALYRRWNTPPRARQLALHDADTCSGPGQLLRLAIHSELQLKVGCLLVKADMGWIPLHVKIEDNKRADALPRTLPLRMISELSQAWCVQVLEI